MTTDVKKTGDQSPSPQNEDGPWNWAADKLRDVGVLPSKEQPSKPSLKPWEMTPSELMGRPRDFLSVPPPAPPPAKGIVRNEAEKKMAQDVMLSPSEKKRAMQYETSDANIKELQSAIMNAKTPQHRDILTQELNSLLALRK